MTNDLTTTTGSSLAKLPTSFGRIGRIDTAEKLITRFNQVEAVRSHVTQACDFEQGRALTEAKDLIPFGGYEAALVELKISSQEASNRRAWYETLKARNFRDLDPAKAEAKLSRGARTAFVRADPDVQEAVIKVINDDDTKKVTAKEIGSWLDRVPTDEELKAGYNKRISEGLINHIETIFMALDEAKVLNVVIDPTTRKALTLLSQSIQTYDKIVSQPQDT